MGRPASKPRLSSLSPRDLGIDVARRLLGRLTRDAEHLTSAAGGVVLPAVVASSNTTDSDLAGTRVAVATAALAVWAQRGNPAAVGAISPASLTPRLDDVLLLAGLDPDAAPPEDPEDPLLLVARAIHARLALLDGEAVGPGDLAVLAGLSAHQVRVLIDAGEVRAKVGKGGEASIKAEEAARWLSGRGVPGFATAGGRR